ncbi:hypothetical protein BD779DRAFT_1576384 [Infundibulicybe gibba]|nr:hypothetical protein BD779DRAFT_1576384 [Infundibulicybe gibba]
MVTELDLWRVDGDSLRLLTIKSDSPHDVPFPCLERLVIRYNPSTYASTELSRWSDMFHSRLYLAPNTTIIENVSPLRHAELHVVSLICCSILGFDKLDRLSGKHDLQRLIRRLRDVYLGTVGLNKKTGHHQESLTKRATIYRINWSAFPGRHKLGHCAGRLPTGEVHSLAIIHFLLLPPSQTIRFFRKLDAAFTALERYPIAHALEILVNQADRLMHEFSRLPKTSFLHNSVYIFHIRAARLLKRWQPMIRAYEARDRWSGEYDMMMKAYKIVHRRAVDV